MENGQANWNKVVDQNIAYIAAKEGFAWGGSFGDNPRFEMSFGQSVGELYISYIYD